MTAPQASDGTKLWCRGCWVCGPITRSAGLDFQAIVDASVSVEIVEIFISRMMRG